MEYVHGRLAKLDVTGMCFKEGPAGSTWGLARGDWTLYTCSLRRASRCSGRSMAPGRRWCYYELHAIVLRRAHSAAADCDPHPARLQPRMAVVITNGRLAKLDITGMFFRKAPPA